MSHSPPHSPSAPSSSGHSLLGLEILRFVCAISVLVWHYQHFFFVGSVKVGFETAAQPWYALLKPFYEGGALGVQAFWCLSGFIFFWKYARPVAQGRVEVRRFALLRFSRLYPLHLATLLLVVALGAWYRHQHGADYVYQYNDWPHFIMQLFMASDWAGRNEWSFNGPIWSISVEVLVYALFYTLCRLGWTRWWQVLGVMGAAIVVHGLKLTPHPIVMCVFYFYLGALTHLVHRALQHQNATRQRIVHGLGCLVLIASTVDLALGKLWPWVYVAVATPPAILLLLHGVRPGSQRWIQWITTLGNTTYASYLLHYPLQLLVADLTGGKGAEVLPLRDPAFLLGYLVVTFSLAAAVYRFYELPAQAWLRRRFDAAPAGRGVVPAS